MRIQVAVGDRVLIQEDATGQATVHQLDPQDSPPVDYRGLAADALTGSDASGAGSTGGSDNQAQGTGSSSATPVSMLCPSVTDDGPCNMFCRSILAATP